MTVRTGSSLRPWSACAPAAIPRTFADALAFDHLGSREQTCAGGTLRPEAPVPLDPGV